MSNDMANMAPTKEFFIFSITKDIKLDAAICELIDNSINAAQKLNVSNSPKGHRVDLYIGKTSTNSNEFLIKDDCGGITRKDAKDKAFVLGNDFKYYKSGFGIGMKRALFKLAEEFTLESYTLDDKFKIEMDLTKWKKNSSWKIPIKNNNKTNIQAGLIIAISRLNEEIKKELISAEFKRKLKNKIKSHYEFKLEAGFEIYFNGEKIQLDYKSKFKNLLPDRTYKIDGNDIRIKIENRSNREFQYYGWNYVINGTTIIQGDKSNLSNWKETIKNKEYNYDKFVGFVIIDGDNISKLPINTTKDGIDINSKMYKVIQEQMKSAIENTRESFRDSEGAIEYKKPLREIEELKVKLRKKSNADVGRETFDRCLNKL